MKVLLFTDCLGAGGAQRQLVGLAVMLIERGYNVKVCTYFNIDFYKKQLDDAGVHNELIPEADNTKKRIIAVRKYFKKEHPDWVIAYQETPSLVACAAKLLGCNYRLLVSERNTTQSIGVKEHVRFFLYHWADMIVPNSYSQARYLVGHYPWMKKQLKIVTNFVDLNHFSFIGRQKRNVPEIVIVASIWDSKNTLGFIDAVRILASKDKKFHVSWYGKSESNLEYYNNCQEKIERYGLRDYIELKEKTKDIKNVYQYADFFCLPSFYEGTPNVICEAISTGLPVVCSDICDNSIYVHEGKNGFLFDPTSTESMVSALAKILFLSTEEYKVFSIYSRKIAEEKLPSDKFANEYMEILGII